MLAASLLSASIAVATAKFPFGPVGCLPKLSQNDRQFEQRINSHLRFVSRGDISEDRFFLTSEANLADTCGRQGKRTIFAVLPLQARQQTWLGVSFDCTSADRRVQRGDLVVGRFSTTGSPTAIEAWVIDGANRRFTPVRNATCHSFDK